MMMTKMMMMHGNSKDAEVVEIGEALTMLDRLVNLKYISQEERQIREDRSAEHKAKSYQLFYVGIKFVW